MVPRDLIRQFEQATRIPDLGGGGRMVGASLTLMASEVPHDQLIIDVGPFIGSTTAFLAVGSQFGDGAAIHSYDPWWANYHFSKKAWRHAKIRLKQNESFYGVWKENLRWCKAPIVAHVGRAERSIPPEGDAKIGMVVDDALSTYDDLDLFWGTFGPRLAIGATVVAMDYRFFETKPAARHEARVQFYRDFRYAFSDPVLVEGHRSMAVEFKYRGGLT